MGGATQDKDRDRLKFSISYIPDSNTGLIELQVITSHYLVTNP